jgi:SAM-dependent methyltransferase
VAAAGPLTRAVARLMSVPRLYRAVQTSIGGELHRQVRALLAASIPDRADVRILDLGCGVGDYAMVFARARYHGIDLEPRYVESARRDFGREGATFAVGDATRLGLTEAAFDYCFSVGLYHHLPDDAVVTSLEQARRAAAPGRVVVVDAIYPPRGNWAGYVLRRLDRGKHVRTLGDYEALLRERFDVVEIRAERGGLLDYVVFRV